MQVLEDLFFLKKEDFLNFLLHLKIPVFVALGVKQGYKKEKRFYKLLLFKRNLYMVQEMKRIEKVINGIPHIFLKGPLLSQIIYGSFYYRVSRDIDILIKKRDLTQIESSLFKLGYKYIKSCSERFENSFLFRRHYKNKRFTIDLHTSIFPKRPREINDDFLWKDIKKVKIGNFYFPSLSERNALFFSILHAWGHGYWGIRDLIDIYYLSKKMKKKDLLMIKEIFRKNGYYNVFNLTYEIIENVFKEKFVDTRRVLPFLIKIVKKNLFLAEGDVRWRKEVIQILTQKNILERLKLLKIVVFPDERECVYRTGSSNGRIMHFKRIFVSGFRNILKW